MNSEGFVWAIDASGTVGPAGVACRMRIAADWIPDAPAPMIGGG
jgi:hypothetical protein